MECGEVDEFHLPAVTYNAEEEEQISPNDLLLLSKEEVTRALNILSLIVLETDLIFKIFLVNIFHAISKEFILRFSASSVFITGKIVIELVQVHFVIPK